MTIDFDKIFTKNNRQRHLRRSVVDIDFDYLPFECESKMKDNGQYDVILWVGYCEGGSLSCPSNNYELSLNDYTHLGIRISHSIHSLYEEDEMIKYVGSDLVPFRHGTCHNQGFLVPRDVIIKLLRKIGVISSIPEDAGDGE